MNDFLIQYNEKKNLVEKYIENLFDENSFPQKNLFEIMKYAVTNGGKRIRPVLMMAAFEVFSDNISEVIPFCAAIELIHSYSLVHDDLPAMDNDSLRRGKPTCHVKFSHFGAILAGDALLNMAFEIMAENMSDYEKGVNAVKIISSASGAKGMCAGQMTDMEGSMEDFSALSVMCSQKTGALLEASVLAGAVLGGADTDSYNKLAEYSKLLGLIFQIKDDVLDVTSTSDIMGKTVGKDEKNDKITFVSKYGLKKSVEIISEHKNNAVGILKSINGETMFLQELTEYMAERSN